MINNPKPKFIDAANITISLVGAIILVLIPLVSVQQQILPRTLIAIVVCFSAAVIMHFIKVLLYYKQYFAHYLALEQNRDALKAVIETRDHEIALHSAFMEQLEYTLAVALTENSTKEVEQILNIGKLVYMYKQKEV